VLSRGGLQARRTYSQPHQDFRFVVLRVVPPKRRQRLFDASITYGRRKKFIENSVEVKQQLKDSEGSDI
jgi:hypothetical protein